MWERVRVRGYFLRNCHAPVGHPPKMKMIRRSGILAANFGAGRPSYGVIWAIFYLN